MVKTQTPVALLCVLMIAASMLGLVPLPAEAVTALAVLAGAVGVKRPSETAAELAAAMHKETAEAALERLKNSPEPAEEGP